MILDTSAMLAILLREPQCQQLLETLGRAPVVGIGAPTMAEAGIVLYARMGAAGLSMLGRLVQETEAVILPFGASHWQVAVDAFARFGKGRHPAALNFGDCQAYATAVLARQPLLAVGDDFARTDLPLA